MEAWRQTDLFEGEVLLRDIEIDAACSSELTVSKTTYSELHLYLR